VAARVQQVEVPERLDELFALALAAQRLELFVERLREL